MKFKIGEIVRIKSSEFSWDCEARARNKSVFGRIINIYECDGCEPNFKVNVLDINLNTNIDTRYIVEDAWTYLMDEIFKITKEDEDEVLAWLI